MNTSIETNNHNLPRYVFRERENVSTIIRIDPSGNSQYDFGSLEDRENHIVKTFEINKGKVYVDGKEWSLDYPIWIVGNTGQVTFFAKALEEFGNSEAAQKLRGLLPESFYPPKEVTLLDKVATSSFGKFVKNMRI